MSEKKVIRKVLLILAWIFLCREIMLFFDMTKFDIEFGTLINVVLIAKIFYPLKEDTND